MPGTIPLTHVEEAAFLVALAREPVRNRCLCVLALHTGLRARSLLAQTVGRVWDGDKVRPILHVDRCQLKGGKGPGKRAVSGRQIPLNHAAVAAIEEFMRERLAFAPVHQDAPLFPGKAAGFLSVWQYNRILQHVVEAAGIASIGRSSHCLRKTFCHRCFELSGWNLVTTKFLMGHRHLATLEAYLCCDEQAAATVIQRLGAPRSGANGSPVSGDETAVG